MPFTLDPEIARCLSSTVATSSIPYLAPGDVLGLRAAIEGSGFDVSFPEAPEVEMTSYSAETEDGGTISLDWYAAPGCGDGAAIVYAHGGAMIAGTAAQYDRLVRLYVSLTGVPFLNVDYRLAPEYQAVGLARDMLAGLKWLLREATSLGIDPARIAVMGDSGGGGVAAAAAILARDNGIALAKQILVYPMLDDRNVRADPFLAPTATWTYDNNRTAWTAILGSTPDDGLKYLVPARLDQFAGLPPAYIEVGEMDIFRDESIDYAQKLLKAGISCELHVHPGVPHGHDWIAPASRLSRQVLAERARVISTF